MKYVEHWDVSVVGGAVYSRYSKNTLKILQNILH